MARNDDILNRQNADDARRYDELITKAFAAKRKIESGFLELAESIAEICKTRLYRLKYKTFAEF